MKEVVDAHRLVNEYVLAESEKKLPEGYSDSASNQFCRDADKSKNKLLAVAYAIHRAES